MATSRRPTRPPPPHEETVGFLLNDIARTLRKRFDRRALTLGLTRAQWLVIFHLSRNEGVNQRTLAGTLEVEPITLTRILDRMEAKGWVVRQADPRDRRAHLLHLTSRARPMLKKLQALAAETRREALVGITARQQAQLVATLQTMKANLARAAALERGDASSHGLEN